MSNEELEDLAVIRTDEQEVYDNEEYNYGFNRGFQIGFKEADALSKDMKALLTEVRNRVGGTLPFDLNERIRKMIK